MFIGDVSLNQMKVLTKGEQLFFFEDKNNIELYAFKAGPFMLRTIVKKPEEPGALISLISHLPENRVKLMSRVIVTEMISNLANKINLIDKRLEEMSNGRSINNL